MSTEHIADATFEGASIVAGIKLRPFTLGSVGLCRKLKLTRFLGEPETDDSLPAQTQIATFAWMQSAPLKSVLAAVRDGSARDAVEEFEFTLTIEQVGILIAEINRLTDQAGAASVAVAPKPGGSEGDQPPGN